MKLICQKCKVVISKEITELENLTAINNTDGRITYQKDSFLLEMVNKI
ncbi:hypothetical protein [Niallia circulans]|nr:hypothetical protein [Niallia circulans]